jgi:hypothetical protein
VSEPVNAQLSSPDRGDGERRSKLAGTSVSDLRYYFAALMRVQAMWFFLAAFPSFVLVFSIGSCVSFQGIHPWIDFAGIQLMFIAASVGWIAPRLLERSWFLRYHQAVSVLNAIILLVAFVVHTRGLAFDGAGLTTECFDVDFGGVWYTVIANLGGALLFFGEFLVVTALRRRRSETI